MKKVNQTQYKKQVIEALETAAKPIWLSDLHRRFGLPYCTIYGKRDNPASKAIRKMIKDGDIMELTPRYYLKNSVKPRRRVCLPAHHSIARNARTYFEVQLVEKIEKMQDQINYFKKKLKEQGINV